MVLSFNLGIFKFFLIRKRIYVDLGVLNLQIEIKWIKQGVRVFEDTGKSKIVESKIMWMEFYLYWKIVKNLYLLQEDKRIKFVVFEY